MRAAHTHKSVPVRARNRIDFRESLVRADGLVGRLHHTWETGSSLPVGADYCTRGASSLPPPARPTLPVTRAARWGPASYSYGDIVYGTEWKYAAIVERTYERTNVLNVRACNNVARFFRFLVSSPYGGET